MYNKLASALLELRSPMAGLVKLEEPIIRAA